MTLKKYIFTIRAYLLPPLQIKILNPCPTDNKFRKFKNIVYIITMHDECKSTEEKIIKFDTFSLCAYVGPIPKGPEPLSKGP